VLSRLPDDYVAWLREWHVTFVEAAAPSDFTVRCNASIDVPVAALLDAPAGEAFAEAPFGTRVIASPPESGWAQVEIPGRRAGWVPAAQLRSGVPPWPCRADAILATLRRFGGVPYVWGGKSPKGFDCSGLVQFAYGLHGVDLPRDSDEQFEAGHAVAQIEPGDLLFFGRESIGHVGVALSAHEFIHARGLVRRNSLSASSPCHDPALAAIYRGARRVLPQEPASRRSA
jgi:cell wall-associated NlpC family hydrolase